MSAPVSSKIRRVDPEKATSVRRAVELLLALGDEEALASGGLGVMRLADMLDEDKSRVSRTLRTLQEYALVQRDPETLTYSVGWRVYALARRAGDARLLHAARARIAGLVREFDESAHLSVLTGMRVLTVMSQAPERTVAANSWVGRTIPAHCTSSGRALLLDEDRDTLERRFEGQLLQVAGPSAPHDVDELYRRIMSARALGYATALEESEAGLVAVAAPVRDHRGAIVAALNISAPAFRFQQRLRGAGERIRRAAQELSREIGWLPDTIKTREP